MTLSESLERCIQAWKQMGVQLLPPAHHDKIDAIMKEIGRRASADIFQLYESSGGFAGGACDAHVWSFWPLERVREVNDAYPRPQMAFSDGLIDSFYLCFQFEDELVSSVWVDHGIDMDLVRVADSLAEFFELYLSHPERIGLV